MDDLPGLRPAVAEDLPGAVALLVAARLVTDGLEDAFGPGFVVAESKGRVVALAGVERHGEFGLLRSVAVEPGVRGRGWGRSLVEDRVRWARSHGLRALYLLTETAPGFFEGSGFRRVDRSRVPEAIRDSVEFAAACPESAVVLVLDL